MRLYKGVYIRFAEGFYAGVEGCLHGSLRGFCRGCETGPYQEAGRFSLTWVVEFETLSYVRVKSFGIGV